jgi:hypothetical protein
MKTLIASLSLVLAVLVHAQPAEKKQPISTLYPRVGAKLEQNPELAKAFGHPPQELRDAAWLVGRWKVTSRSFLESGEPGVADHGESTVTAVLGGTWLEIRDSYKGNPEDLGFLTFNVVTKEWVSISIDKSGNAVTAKAPRWDGNRLVLAAEDANIVGEHVVLRQTLEKQSDREYRIVNEERLASGEWALIDEYVYRKQ